MWAKNGRLPENSHYTTTTLFGEHLLPMYPTQTVVLVESPKNAIVGALEYPGLLWLATGNKCMLQRKYMEPLRGREVIVIPDRDSIEPWEQTVSTMKDLAFFTVSDIVLIFNTFTGSSTYGMRIANLSFYYAGQLLIALSLLFA